MKSLSAIIKNVVSTFIFCVVAIISLVIVFVDSYLYFKWELEKLNQKRQGNLDSNGFRMYRDLEVVNRLAISSLLLLAVLLFLSNHSALALDVFYIVVGLVMLFAILKIEESRSQSQ